MRLWPISGSLKEIAKGLCLLNFAENVCYRASKKFSQSFFFVIYYLRVLSFIHTISLKSNLCSTQTCFFFHWKYHCWHGVHKLHWYWEVSHKQQQPVLLLFSCCQRQACSCTFLFHWVITERDFFGVLSGITMISHNHTHTCQCQSSSAAASLGDFSSGDFSRRLEGFLSP